MKIIVTGGCGFIGSHLIDFLLKQPGVDQVINIDCLTYASNLYPHNDSRYRHYKADILNVGTMIDVFGQHQADWVIHLAAETHVDRSIESPYYFMNTNVMGTLAVLAESKMNCAKRFLYVSTDEVYGSVDSPAHEDHRFNPSSPYSASKAAADLLVQAYMKTYNFPAMIIRPSNTFGPRQHPEKLIPKAINLLTQNQKVPIYGKGHQCRTWLWIDDLLEAIWLVMTKAKIGSIYNVGGLEPMANLRLINWLITLLGKPEQDLIEFVKDRPAHDFRYWLDCESIRSDLGWEPKTRIEDGLQRLLKITS